MRLLKNRQVKITKKSGEEIMVDLVQPNGISYLSFKPQNGELKITYEEMHQVIALLRQAAASL